MYEKLLALLNAKFAQARKDGLSQLARSLAIQVADETEAQALVDKIQDSQVTTFIKEWRKDVDSEVSKGTQTFEENLKSKYDLTEKKAPTPPDNPTDISATIARAVEAAMKPLTDKISQLESGKTGETRKAALIGKLADAPESFKNTVLKHFDKMNFESEEDFNSFLTETEADSKTIEQDLAHSGLNGFPRPAIANVNSTAKVVGSDIAEWAKSNKID